MCAHYQLKEISYILLEYLRYCTFNSETDKRTAMSVNLIFASLVEGSHCEGRIIKK